jgi:hypothetical protein
MRTTSQVRNTEFPFASDLVAFVLVVNDGETDTTESRGFEHASTAPKKKALVEQAIALSENPESTAALLAVWPGKSRSDVFLVDDLDAALEALSA